MWMLPFLLIMPQLFEAYLVAVRRSCQLRLALSFRFPVFLLQLVVDDDVAIIIVLGQNVVFQCLLGG